MGTTKKRLEIHEHCIISGLRSHRTGSWPDGMGSKFSHSHEGGDKPHTHPDTGPASYVIDRDEWARATGLSGGGRKKFTARPTGEQYAVLPQEPAVFDIFILDSGVRGAWDGKMVVVADGAARDSIATDSITSAAAERMKIASGMRARVHDLRARAKAEATR